MATSTEIEELRDLLDVADKKRLELLDFRIRELEQQIERLNKDRDFRSKFVADVLPKAVNHRDPTDLAFTKSVKPHVVESIHLSSRNEPDDMAAALYPVLGPAIRKMIASYFTLDRSTGSFAPEQVFLIEPQTGLVVQHVSIETSPEDAHDAAGEADVISGMLEAIRSFVQDSFDVNDHDGMRELAVGDITIWVEWSPTAILACVVRGVATAHYRTAMQQTLEGIQSQFDHQLVSYEGDPDTMTALKPHLESLLHWELDDKQNKPSRVASSSRTWIALGIVVLAALAVAVIGF